MVTRSLATCKFSRCDIVIYCGCYGRIYTFIVRTDVETMSKYTACRVYASFRNLIAIHAFHYSAEGIRDIYRI